MRRSAVPHYPPRVRRPFIDRLAPRLPVGRGNAQITLAVVRTPLEPGVELVTPWLVLTIRYFAWKLVRLPGRKVVELYDIRADEWMSVRP